MTQRAIRTTTKRDLARAVDREIGCTAALALVLVDALFDAMREHLIQGTASRCGVSGPEMYAIAGRL